MISLRVSRLQKEIANVTKFITCIASFSLQIQHKISI